MNCPTCGAPLRLVDGRDSQSCDYCQGVYLPEKNADGVRVFDQASEFRCPVCDVPLMHAAVAHQRLLYCTHCRGMLIAMAVFVAVVERLRARRGDAVEISRPPDARELERNLSCPGCGGRMDTHFYAGGGNVVLDDCSRCEVNWLDAGELLTIGRAPDHTLRDNLTDL